MVYHPGLDKVEGFLERYPQLRVIYWIKERLWNVYESRGRMETSVKLDTLIRDLRGASCNSLLGSGKIHYRDGGRRY